MSKSIRFDNQLCLQLSSIMLALLDKHAINRGLTRQDIIRELILNHLVDSNSLRSTKTTSPSV